MFDIGWTEIMVIVVVALVVIGPKDLPKAIYTVGKWVRKARGVAREFQHHVDDLMREAELDELRQQALKARDLNLTRMVEDTVDPKGTLRSAFDPPALDGSGPAPPAVPAPAAGATPAIGETPVVASPPVPPPAAEPPAIPPAERPAIPLAEPAMAPPPADPASPQASPVAAQHPDKTA